MPTLIFREAAGAAIPTALVPIGVYLIVGMAFWAVRLGRVYRSEANATQGVLAISNRLQMARVDAMAYATEVVELQPFGDRPNEQFICNSMRAQSPGVDADHPVATPLGNRTRPQPAAIGIALVDLRPEPLLQSPRSVGAVDIRRDRHQFANYPIYSNAFTPPQ
jgi:hypothetical protein